MTGLIFGQRRYFQACGAVQIEFSSPDMTAGVVGGSMPSSSPSPTSSPSQLKASWSLDSPLFITKLADQHHDFLSPPMLQTLLLAFLGTVCLQQHQD